VAVDGVASAFRVKINSIILLPHSIPFFNQNAEQLFSFLGTEEARFYEPTSKFYLHGVTSQKILGLIFVFAIMRNSNLN
jgi:hypothetical protein